MSDLLRVAFANTSKTLSVTLQITTQDDVESCELLTTTPATLPEQSPGIKHAAGQFDLEVPAGRIIGFTSAYPIGINNPNSSIVVTVFASGKNPWPNPPPPAALLVDVSDFATRFAHFLTVGGVSNEAASEVVMTLSVE
jgi:hypothetical protein